MRAASKQLATRFLIVTVALFTSSNLEQPLFGTRGAEQTSESRYESDVANSFFNNLHRSGINIDGPRRIPFPSITVVEYPQDVYSSSQTLRLTNKNFKKGWLLGASIFQNQLIGAKYWERIPAEFQFKSITWVQGGTGSTAGIEIHSSGRSIEADPSFGKGTYDIEFEVVLKVPAFAYADQYYGVCSFIIQ
ncbi:MAG: hypothetical protein ACI92G_003520 [Candidatus Pelagisphaera sp.]|jgi:hypothetical protein